MGTRNLTIVKSKGVIKISQYGQWDGYPTGQGSTIAEFFKDCNIPEFKKKVNKLKAWNDKQVDKLYENAGASNGMISLSDARKVENVYPELSRDTGARILSMINSGQVTKVQLHPESFIEDTLWCEYYYIIDLDNETISMNGGKHYPINEWTEDLMEQFEAERD